MSKTGIEVETNPQFERRTRRRFSAVEKQRLLSESDQLAHGDQGAWLRRNDLYAAQLSMWRKQLSVVGSTGLEPQSPGRKSKAASVRELEQLRRENAKLQRRAEHRCAMA